ncbi:hypothetical protein AGMMS4956_18550 [Bacteroidia bacterium]|nr:hypothetical protein AGMMS4956_18550 [Bacteroidia bacterium]
MKSKDRLFPTSETYSGASPFLKGKGNIKFCKKIIKMEETQKIQAVKEFVLELFHEVKNSDNAGNKPITIGFLTKSAEQYLSALSGLHFKDPTRFVLNTSDLRHIYKEHYGNNEKDKGNNIPLSDADIKNMIDVIANPDKILFLGIDKDTNAHKFAFLKATETKSTYNLLEVYGNSRGQLTAKTFYNTKKSIGARVMNLRTNSQPSTSETATHPIDTSKPEILFIVSSRFLNSKGITSFSEKQENSQKVFQKAVRSAALEAVNKYTDAQRAQEETTKMPEQKRSLNL